MLKRVVVSGAFAAALVLSGPARAADPTADTVVATVNGSEITLGHMISLRETLPPQYLQLPDDALFTGLLDQIIQQTALAQTAGDDLSKRDALALENQRRGYMAGSVLDKVASGAVTDEALQGLYDEKYANAAPSTEYHAAHILVTTEEEAKALKAELDGGADFTTLAKEKSTGPSGPNGGDLGWFGLGMMVKPFEDAVIAMKSGSVSDPVQTDFGWHLINLIETRTADAPTLEDSRDELANELQQKAVEARVTEITEAAKVEKMTDGIDPAIIKRADLLDN